MNIKQFEYVWHLRDKTVDDTATITIVAQEWTFPNKSSDELVVFRYGVSICAPYDQFSREYGRKNAKDRLNFKNKTGYFGTLFVINERVNRANVLFGIASDLLLTNKRLPYNADSLLIQEILKTPMVDETLSNSYFSLYTFRKG
jgi:hypothetical protein